MQIVYLVVPNMEEHHIFGGSCKVALKKRYRRLKVENKDQKTL
jgi:hypothetical protein